ncbi:MAG: hypothetical protein OHK0039_46080 [Bacteroidia bacterium]
MRTCHLILFVSMLSMPPIVRGQDLHVLRQQVDSLQPVWQWFDPYASPGIEAIRQQSQLSHAAALRSLPLASQPDELISTRLILAIACYQLGTYDSAYALFEQVYHTADPPCPPRAQMVVNMFRGIFALRANAFDSSLVYFDRAATLAQRLGDSLILGRCRLSQGQTLAQQHDLSAMLYYEQAQDIFSRLGDSTYMFVTNGNLAVLYIHAREFERALAILNETENYLINGKRQAEAMINRGNKIFTLIKLGCTAEALVLAEEALASEPSFPLGKWYIFNLAAMAHQEMGQWSQAAHYMALSRKKSGKLTHATMESCMYYLLGRQAEHEQRYAEAEQHYIASLQGALPGKELAGLEYSLEALAHLYDLRGDTLRAGRQYRRLYAIEDSLNNQWRRNSIELLEARRELTEQQKTIALLAKEAEIDQLYKALMGGTIIAALLIAALSIIQLRLRYERRRQRELAQQNQVLESYSRDLEELAYAVSHNLKEPARIAGAYAGLLDKRYRSHLDEDGQTYLAFISQAATHINRMLNDLRQYVDIGQMEHPLTDVPLGPVRDAQLALLAALVASQQATIDSDALPVLKGSPQLYGRLLYELLSNALKFKDPERPLHIRLAYQRTAEGHHLTLSDTGIGMAPEHVEQTFRVFHQLDRNIDGTGIGLAIARKIVTY